MKKLQDQLKEVSKALAKLSKQVDKISAQVKKASPAKKAAAPKKKAVKAVKAAKKAAPAKKAKAEKKAATVLDTVYDIIRKARNGATIAVLKKKSELNPRQLSNALYKLSKRGKIEAKSRGLYIKKS